MKTIKYNIHQAIVEGLKEAIKELKQEKETLRKENEALTKEVVNLKGKYSKLDDYIEGCLT